MHLPRETDSNFATPEAAPIQAPDGILRISPVASKLYESKASRPPRVEVAREIAVSDLSVLANLVLELLCPAASQALEF